MLPSSTTSSCYFHALMETIPSLLIILSYISLALFNWGVFWNSDLLNLPPMAELLSIRSWHHILICIPFHLCKKVTGCWIVWIKSPWTKHGNSQTCVRVCVCMSVCGLYMWVCVCPMDYGSLRMIWVIFKTSQKLQSLGMSKQYQNNIKQKNKHTVSWPCPFMKAFWSLCLQS